MNNELKERVNNMREVVMNLFKISEEEMNSKRFNVNFNGPIKNPRSIAILDDYVEAECVGMLSGRRFIDTIIVDSMNEPVKNEESVGINHLDCHGYIDKSGRVVYHDDIEYVFCNPDNVELSGNSIIVLYENYDFNPLGDYDVEVFQLQ